MLCLIFALALPLLLVPIEYIFPIASVVEETAKFFLIFFIIRDQSIRQEHKWICAVFAGIVFTISESALYLVQIWEVGDLRIIPTRLLLTGSLHIVTMLIMYAGFSQKKVIPEFGLALAMILHFIFNHVII